MDIWELIKSQALTKEHLNVKQEYLIDGFLPKRTISVWYSDGGTGKSYLVYGVVKRALEAGMRVIYIDHDNGINIIKERNIESMLDGYDSLNYLHRSSMTMDADVFLDEMSSVAIGQIYENVLLVADSFKDIIMDMSNDVKAAKIMRILMNIREAGGTIIGLHHTNKSGRNYQGSNQIKNSSDIMYSVEQKSSTDGTINYFMKAEKMRAGVVNKGWSLDLKTLNLTEINESEAMMSIYESEFITKIQKILEEEDNMTLSELCDELGSTTDDKTTRSMIDKFDGKYYQSKKLGKKRVFSLVTTNVTNVTNEIKEAV